MKLFQIVSILLIGGAALTGNAENANKMLRACYGQSSKTQLITVANLTKYAVSA